MSQPKYHVIEIFTSEESRWQGTPVYNAIIDVVKQKKIAARCIVSKAIAGCYENGEVATQNLEVLSYNMPLKIEIILPQAELSNLLPDVEEIVTEGIIAVEDMEVRCHKTRKRLIPRQIKVKDAMTPHPKSVQPETTLDTIIEMLMNSDFNTIPVVNKHNQPIGIITQGDLLKRGGLPIRLGLFEQLEKKKIEDYLDTVSHKKAEDIMTKNVITIHEEKRLGEAVDLMLKHKLKRLPVVNDKNSLVGIIARLDVFQTIISEAPDWKKLKTSKVFIADAKFVSDVVERDIQTISPNAQIEEVIKTIKSGGVQRIAVVDENKRLLGLISDYNLLTAFSDHRAGLWDYLVSKLPLGEISKQHKIFAEQIKMKIASDVMKKDLVTVKEDTLIDDAIKIMTDKALKRLPVVDENGVFKGMISRDSVLRAGFKKV